VPVACVLELERRAVERDGQVYLGCTLAPEQVARELACPLDREHTHEESTAAAQHEAGDGDREDRSRFGRVGRLCVGGHARTLTWVGAAAKSALSALTWIAYALLEVPP